MKLKIASLNFMVLNLKALLVLLCMVSSSFSVAQSIANVSPTRITTGSKITITGNGFDRTTLRNITIPDMTIDNRNLVSSSIMTFEITNEGSSNIPNRVLTIGDGISANSYPITYIAPVSHTLASDKHFNVKEIYTDWDYNGNGFWKSSDWSVGNTAASPNNKHKLLGYKIRPLGGAVDIIYSTGVNDSLLETKLVDLAILTQQQIVDGILYKKKVFKAYSTNGVRGTTSGLNFLMIGDMVDGIEAASETPEDFASLTEIKALTILEVIIDGKNGLELGTAVGNFNSKTDVQFFSGNGRPGVLGDDAPDLLITQMADPGPSDVYYYAKENGDVVGHPIKLTIQKTGSPYLANWKLNLFTFADGLDFASANPNGRATKYIEDRFRPIRMVAFKLEDFGVGTPEAIQSINNVNMNSGGSADIAFMAYNQETFNIKGPVAKTILPQYVCRIVNNSSVTFKIKVGRVEEEGNVGIEDFNVPGQIRGPETSDGLPMLFEYQLWKDGVAQTVKGATADALTISDITESKLGIYKLRIENGQGSVIVPVELAEGGTPVVWNGTWSSPYGDFESIDKKERGLVFISDYNQIESNLDEVVDLEGCDCFVAAGVDVAISTGQSVKLYGKISIASEVAETMESPYRPAGTFTLKDGASLLQTKNIIANENLDKIVVERIAKGLKPSDYVYWSSPVAENPVANLPGNKRYEWNVEAANHEGTSGNWVAPTNTYMTTGKGYIVRVTNPSGSDLATNYARKNSFYGVPNNGDYTIMVKTSPIPIPTIENRDWNLIGNPYPSAISVDKFLIENATGASPLLKGFVQVWTHGTAISSGGDIPFYDDRFKNNYNQDDYLTYNLLGGTVPDHIKESTDGNGVIASGQGFVVQAEQEGFVKFTNAMRYDENEEAYENDVFYRNSERSQASLNVNNEKQLLWLSLSNDKNIATVALVGYAEGATNGDDHLYDAVSLGDVNFRLYSHLDDKKLVIQGRALPFDDTDQVSLGIAVPKNGIYRLGIDHLKGSVLLNKDQGIYLEDTYNNVIHNLRTTPYSFTANAGDLSDRFVLRYTDQTLSVDELQTKDTFVYVRNNQLYVKASQHIENVVVYDLAGKKLMDHKINGKSDAFNTPFQFPKGIYLTQIKLENASVVTKKVTN